MNTFQIGDIVIGNNPWLNSLLGFYQEPGIIIYKGMYSSEIYLLLTEETIILVNEYVEKVESGLVDYIYEVGDLVTLKPEIKKEILIQGPGIVVDKITISGFDMIDHDATVPIFKAYVIYFVSCDTEYTIPINCVTLFSPIKND